MRSIQYISIQGIALHWIMRLGTMFIGVVTLSVGSALGALAQRFPYESEASAFVRESRLSEEPTDTPLVAAVASLNSEYSTRLPHKR